MNSPSQVNAELAINLITALWLGGIGACIGSFLNVVAYRLPLGMSVIWKPSHCPRCSNPIRARDNVPVLGWLWLRGRCRDCGEPISPRYAVVEFLMGIAFLLLAYFEIYSGGQNLPSGPLSPYQGAIDNIWIPNWPLLGTAAYHGIFISLIFSVTLIDLDQNRTPTKLLSFGLATGIGIGFCYPFLQPSAPWFSLDGLRYFNSLVGTGLGWALGGLGSKLIQLRYQNKLVAEGWNLKVGLSLIGGFLGWQGIFSMVVVILISCLVPAPRKMPNKIVTTYGLVPTVLLHICTWKLLCDMLATLAT